MVKEGPEQVESEPNGYRVKISLMDSASISKDQPGVSTDGVYTFSIQVSFQNKVILRAFNYTPSCW